MSNYRIPMLEKELFKLICKTLLYKVRDSAFSEVNITHVKLTKDLRYLKVYYYHDDSVKIKKMEEKLRKVSGFLKKQIAGAGIMRVIPDLNYHFDETEAKADHIEKLLATVREDSYDDRKSDFSLDEFLLEDEYVPEDFEDLDGLDEMFEEEVAEDE
jgi:ribosome-binding factor A